MKKQLKFILILIALCLTGIIIFQAYWAINAYRVNKTKFNTDIDLAMQQALDSCKKDYFDSIRVVLIKRFSDPLFKYKLDTLKEADTAHAMVTITIAGISPPLKFPKSTLKFYQQKIRHKNSIPELLAEMCFYVPSVWSQTHLRLLMQDMTSPTQFMRMFVPKEMQTPINDLAQKNNNGSLLQLPPNYRMADMQKIDHYFKQALQQRNIYDDHAIIMRDSPTVALRDSSHTAFTSEYSYKYHGFVKMDIKGPELFVRAGFLNPQYIILHGMLLTLSLSLILVLFTTYCFYYVYRTIIDQKKLADLKDDFINNMTHELKTPIATINVAIEGLQSFNALQDPEKTQRYLETSRKQLNHLNNLVNKVLNVAAFENKEFDLNLQQVDINELINEVIATEKLKATKEVHIDYVNKDNITNIQADALHLKNILVNLIDNAVKYSGDRANITVTCSNTSSGIAISIKDQGAGIAPANLNKVFDKFYRVPSGNVHNVKGTGLGLSYVKYITEAHGGSVTATSTFGLGSEFIVTLPLK